MQVTCAACQHVSQLDDTKLPEGVFKIRCSKCGKIITAERKRNSEQIPETIRDFLRQEMAALKQELANVDARPAGESTAPAGPLSTPAPVALTRRALVSEADQATAEKIGDILKQSGYLVEFARTPAETIKRIDNQPFSLITVASSYPDDKEGGKKLIAKINGKKPDERRKTFVLLISGTVKTGDVNSAFFEGTNITVNIADLPNLPTLIAEGQLTFREIYRVFDSVTTEKEQNL
jgi:CheY-like chemotaxis protein